MIEYLYIMLFLLMFLIVINKIRITLLIKSKLGELRNKREGLILFNEIKKSNFLFIKKYSRQYEFTVWGYCELKMRDSSKIKEGFIYIMPLELKLTHHLAKQLVEDGEICKKRDSKEELKNYYIKKKELNIYNQLYD